MRPDLKALVTFAGIALVVLSSGSPSFAASKKSAKSGQHSEATVDVNTASQADLEALPGVGPATAKKIIAGRPYASVADLSKAGVSAATIKKISGQVTVSAPAAKETTPAPASAPARQERSRGTSSSSSTALTPPVKGMVWVNLNSKIYHYEGDHWYGNSKNGKFMTESDAIKAGYRAAKHRGESSKK